MIKKPKVTRKIFKILTGVIVGSAVGSILGLTLAPKKGAETRKAIRDKSMEIFLRSRKAVSQDKNIGAVKRVIIKVLTRKK